MDYVTFFSHGKRVQKKRQETCLLPFAGNLILLAATWRRRSIAVVFPDPVVRICIRPAAIDDLHFTERLAPFVFDEDGLNNFLFRFEFDAIGRRIFLMTVTGACAFHRPEIFPERRAPPYRGLTHFFLLLASGERNMGAADNAGLPGKRQRQSRPWRIHRRRPPRKNQEHP